MSVDIEYPLPDDLVGPIFRAGGEYSVAQIVKSKSQVGKQPAAEKDDSPRILSLPPNSRVICTLFHGTATLDTKTDELEGDPNSGTWEVEFSVNPATDATDCHIVAEFYVNGVPNDNETTTGIDIRPVAAGGITIIMTQP